MSVRTETELIQEIERLRAALGAREREAALKERQLERYAADLRETFKQERTRAQELQRSYTATVSALSNAVEARDAYTGQHAERVAAYGMEIARVAGLPLDDVTHLQFGFLLHDIGKVAIPDAILYKPDRLTDEERALIEQHPVIGAEIVGRVEFLSGSVEVVRSHHERWDGAGISRRARRRGDPARGARVRCRRRARRADDRPSVPAQVELRGRAGDDHLRVRHPFRPAGDRGVQLDRRPPVRGDRSTDLMSGVLIVDDDEFIRKLIATTLEDVARLELHEAGDGLEAVEVARREHPRLVFLDVDMPGLNGIETCRRLRDDEATGSATIVMLTAAHGDGVEALAEEAGADLFLTKPFSPLDLLRLVDRLDGEQQL